MASHAQSFGGVDLPRPGRAALPLLVVALVALALAAAPQLRLARAAGAACFAHATAFRADAARAERRAIRRSADRLILASAVGVEGSDVVRWRTLELVEAATPQRLARGVEEMLR